MELPDISYIRKSISQCDDVGVVGAVGGLAEGRFLSPATVIDPHSCRLAGRSIADHTRTEPVTDALRAAAATEGGNPNGAIFHGDRLNSLPSSSVATIT